MPIYNEEELFDINEVPSQLEIRNSQKDQQISSSINSDRGQIHVNSNFVTNSHPKINSEDFSSNSTNTSDLCVSEAEQNFQTNLSNIEIIPKNLNNESNHESNLSIQSLESTLQTLKEKIDLWISISIFLIALILAKKLLVYL